MANIYLVKILQLLPEALKLSIPKRGCGGGGISSRLTLGKPGITFY